MNISPKNMDDPDRDRFVMSKGHSVEAYYAVLAAKGFFPMEYHRQQLIQHGIVQTDLGVQQTTLGAVKIWSS